MYIGNDNDVESSKWETKDIILKMRIADIHEVLKAK